MDIISLRKSNFSSFTKELNTLQLLKRSKLDLQASYAKELNAIYTAFQNDSKKVIKSLDAAIAISNRPGDIKYTVIKDQNLDNTRILIEKINTTEEEIKLLDIQINALDNKQKSMFSDIKNVSSLDDWFDKNGRPEKLYKPEYNYVTNFKPSKKYLPRSGIDELTGTFSPDKLKEQAPKSAVVSMVRGRLAVGSKNMNKKSTV